MEQMPIFRRAEKAGCLLEKKVLTSHGFESSEELLKWVSPALEMSVCGVGRGSVV